MDYQRSVFLYRTTLKPPVPQLLKINTPPTGKERALVVEALNTAQGLLAKLKYQLNHSRIGSKPINNEATPRSIIEIESFIYEHRSLLSPIRILPSEILVMIFMACLPDLVNITSQPCRRISWKDNPSFHLSQVCRYWRLVALGTPRLWTTLGDIDLEKTSGYAMSKYSRFIEDILRRSQQMDLFIYVHAPRTYEAKDHPVIKLLLENSHRWAILAIRASNFTINLFCEKRNGITVHFPRLQKLDLRISMCHLAGAKITGFLHSPLLKDFAISGFYPGELRIPYKQLQSYKEGPGGASMRNNTGFGNKILMHGSRLERLEITDLRYPLVSPPRATRKVRILHFEIGDPYRSIYAEGLFHSLCLPSLEELRLQASYTLNAQSIINLINRSTLAGSRWALRILSLQRISRRYTDLESILQLTPRLEKLEVDLLISPLSKPTILKLVPELRDLVLHISLSEVYRHQAMILAFAVAIVQCPSDTRSESSGGDTADFFRITPTLRIVLHDKIDLDEAQAILNCWSNTADINVQTNALPILRLWDKILGELLPQLYRTTRKIDRLFESLARLDKVLKDIENFDLKAGKGRAYIPIARIYFALRHLSEIQETHIVGDTIYKYRERSKKILEKWDIVPIADTSTRWMRKGLRSLVYVPEHASSQTLTMVLGRLYGSEDHCDWKNT